MSANKRLSVAEKKEVIPRVDSGETQIGFYLLWHQKTRYIVKYEEAYNLRNGCRLSKKKSMKMSEKFEGADKLLWEGFSAKRQLNKEMTILDLSNVYRKIVALDSTAVIPSEGGVDSWLRRWRSHHNI